MDDLALAVLKIVEAWEWPITSSGETSSRSKVKAIMLKLLSSFITQSQLLGGTLLDHFWDRVEKCHPKLKDNSGSMCHAVFTLANLFKVTNLKHLMISKPFPTEQAMENLLQGIDPEQVDFTAVLQMAA